MRTIKEEITNATIKDIIGELDRVGKNGNRIEDIPSKISLRGNSKYDYIIKSAYFKTIKSLTFAMIDISRIAKHMNQENVEFTLKVYYDCPFNYKLVNTRLILNHTLKFNTLIKSVDMDGQYFPANFKLEDRLLNKEDIEKEPCDLFEDKIKTKYEEFRNDLKNNYLSYQLLFYIFLKDIPMNSIIDSLIFEENGPKIIELLEDIVKENFYQFISFDEFYPTENMKNLIESQNFKNIAMKFSEYILKTEDLLC